MKVRDAFLAAMLAVVPIVSAAPSSSAVVVVGVRPGHYCWHHACWRYHWHGAYYNYYWHGRYWRTRWWCAHRWCYR